MGLLKSMSYVILAFLAMAVLSYVFKPADAKPATKERFASSDDILKTLDRLEKEVAIVMDSVKRVRAQAAVTKPTISKFEDKDDQSEAEDAEPEPEPELKRPARKQEPVEKFESEKPAEYQGVTSSMLDNFMLLAH